MSITNNLIGELYKVNPPGSWDTYVFDIPGERGLVPHTAEQADLTIHPTQFIRDAVRFQIVKTTVPDEYQDTVPMRPSVAVRTDKYLIAFPTVIAECSDWAQHDERMMRNNVSDFLNHSPDIESLLYQYLQNSRDELAVLMGEKTAQKPTANLLNLWRVWETARNSISTKISLIDREANDLRTGWVMDVFYRKGMVPHFEECERNAQELRLQDYTGRAAELSTDIANAYLAGSKLAYEKLKLLKAQGK